jgi:hypothetical protein
LDALSQYDLAEFSSDLRFKFIYRFGFAGMLSRSRHYTHFSPYYACRHRNRSDIISADGIAKKEKIARYDF